MKMPVILTLIFICSFCFGEPSEDIDFSEALERARLDEKLLARHIQKKVFKIHAKTAAYFMKSCAENIDQPQEAFTVVFETDADGKVIYSWLSPMSDHAKCFAGITFRKHFPKPEKTPFYTFVEWIP